MIQMASLFDLNGPGRYVHWSIFQISIANLVVVLVMMAIFGLALLLPFPGKGEPDLPPEHVHEEESAEATVGSEASAEERADSRMWTNRLRSRALQKLPPHKMLPDRQPAYVASWVYIFGVATVAALGLAIVSGFTIALGGTDWWHNTAIGHFFNSMHMWSVELFMALMVIHLWGKFWMAAWRGKRTMTWITGVVAFLASIVECFTGYLSQQNFDSQWISTNGKDAINATGFGAFFNLMNFGQMLLWHVVLIPLVLIAIVGSHVLLVRVHGVSQPIPVAKHTRQERRETAKAEARAWRGPSRRYDILKEATVATALILVLVLLLAGILSSPDEPPVTIQTWVQAAPADFLGTAASELEGTSETAQYGPPYNHGTGSVQSLLFAPSKITGVRQPIDTAQTFVLSPLSKFGTTDPSLQSAVSRYESAGSSTQQNWDQAYLTALNKVKFRSGIAIVPSANDGPVPTLMATELLLARDGALDSDLIADHQFYGTNFTDPLLFLEDGNYFATQATTQNLTGSQWGVTNETGSYPGQPWLWLYQLWYELPGFRNSANVDLIAIVLTGAATALLLAVPFIPGLRDIPRLVPVHRLIWREWNSKHPDPDNTSKR